MTDFEKALVSPTYRWLAIAADGECAETAEYLHRTFQRSNRERRGLALKAIGEGRVAVLVQSLNRLGYALLMEADNPDWLHWIGAKGTREFSREMLKKADRQLRSNKGMEIPELLDAESNSVEGVRSRALRCFQLGRQLEGPGGNSHSNQGMYHVAVGDYDLAVDLYSDLMRAGQSPQIRDGALVNLTVCLVDARRPEDAVGLVSPQVEVKLSSQFRAPALVNKCLAAASLGDRNTVELALNLICEYSTTQRERTRWLEFAHRISTFYPRNRVPADIGKIIHSFVEKYK